MKSKLISPLAVFLLTATLATANVIVKVYENNKKIGECAISSPVQQVFAKSLATYKPFGKKDAASFPAASPCKYLVVTDKGKQVGKVILMPETTPKIYVTEGLVWTKWKGIVGTRGKLESIESKSCKEFLDGVVKTACKKN